jgi:hypothetical protein
MQIRLFAGRWFAGIDTPLGASDSMIRSKLAEYGFANVQLHERDEVALPAGVTPSSDSWDKWGSADYAGKPTTVDLHEAVTWTIAPTNAATPTTPAASNAPKKAQYSPLAVLAMLFALDLAVRRRRR